MKKFLGILFLLVIIAAGVCAYVFPGTPYYYKCTHELDLTDNIWENAPTTPEKLPDDYENYSGFDLRITAWGDMRSERTNNKEQLTWKNDDGSHTLSIFSEKLNENSDFLDRTGITKEALEKYCKTAEKTTPENAYEFIKLVTSLTMDDFDIHNFKNAKTFYQLMKLKEEYYMGDGYPARFYAVDGVGFRGFLITAKSPDNNNYAMVNIYPEKDKRTCYHIDLSVTDQEDVVAVAESIKLT
ncbi:MAG: hypothetical protein K6G33_06815 [Ruminococcus sp.]|uniref:hypothetical protein n=1 Tax=Ruminococcus sp. TaxID=41978 RepID=UPI0025F9AB83|nr:hypothetical protein [Ruminococcus sp.]MCR5600431.1 hypothetical protein [Ruminococcus sp.]